MSTIILLDGSRVSKTTALQTLHTSLANPAGIAVAEAGSYTFSFTDETAVEMLSIARQLMQQATDTSSDKASPGKTVAGLIEMLQTLPQDEVVLVYSPDDEDYMPVTGVTYGTGVAILETDEDVFTEPYEDAMDHTEDLTPAQAEDLGLPYRDNQLSLAFED